MKKKYETPFAEKIDFNFKNQVIASNEATTGTCTWKGTVGYGFLGCTDKILIDEGMNN